LRTLGLRFKPAPEDFSDATSLPGHIWQLLQTIWNKQNSDYLNHHEYLRTINIDSLGFNALQFNLNPEEQARLLESGAKAVDDYFYNRVLMIIAVQQGDVAEVKRLLSSCPLDGPASMGEFLLDIAFQNRHCYVVILLLKAGIYASKQPQSIAAMLEDALQSPFVDKGELAEILLQFHEYHPDVFQQTRSFSFGK
jgi:hypothetical protein